MDSEKTFLRIVKFSVIIICIFGIIGRVNIPSESATLYMIIVNVMSFFISINLLMFDCYSKLRKKYRASNDNIIRKTRTWNLVMITYLAIFIINIVLAFILFHLYLNTLCRHDVLNDILGILSLGFAISTDFLSEFMTNILWYIATQ